MLETRCHIITGKGRLAETARRLASIHGGAFRAPHHTVSVAALAEEIALSAGGVLYLDSAWEWGRQQLRCIEVVCGGMDHRVRPLILVGFRSVDIGSGCDLKLLDCCLHRVADMFWGWRIMQHHVGGEPPIVDRCMNCGSPHVEAQAWIKVNASGLAEDCEGPGDELWCPQCEAHGVNIQLA